MGWRSAASQTQGLPEWPAAADSALR